MKLIENCFESSCSDVRAYIFSLNSWRNQEQQYRSVQCINSGINLPRVPQEIEKRFEFGLQTIINYNKTQLLAPGSTDLVGWRMSKVTANIMTTVKKLGAVLHTYWSFVITRVKFCKEFESTANCFENYVYLGNEHGNSDSPSNLYIS